ncbi:hypothetical protein VB713_26910 [Anabaena cylindrica UHCC 0172]|uniref:hypothetical protein n=1 Tax=Anabaena cylindrica TaxID=1165 RepID=UPI002B20ED54|nr:hypothetical protein [Anabaena cylindrica]MEA5554564.1 hypothetical protein [Anabaena cylindrica UHCC 0172]
MSSPNMNPENDMYKIKNFEINELDKALEELPSLVCDSQECFELASLTIEYAYTNISPFIGQSLRNGLSILAPYFIANNSHNYPNIESLMSDINFGYHYYIIREYLYYTYNSLDSFSWKFDKNKVEIKFTNPTIPRQFFIAANNHILGSIMLFSNYQNSNQIIELLKGEEEFSVSKKIEQAWELIVDEVEMKLSNYYNFLDPESQIKLGDYSYSQFYKIYKTLLTKALFHRYYGQSNGIASQIYMPISEIVHDLSQTTELSPEVCFAIIKDMSYSIEAQQNKIQPLYFSLYNLQPKNHILMMPCDFCFWEGLVSMLRIWAIKYPKIFLNSLNSQLSNNFVNHVSEMFSNQGFTCAKNVCLSQFDKSLPDIDLLVISEEPTLGYVVYCCEVKNPLPPKWSKDQLKVLNKDSVMKGFGQIERIGKFLASEEGIIFLRNQLPKEGLPHFGNQFLMMCNSLIITSDNAGMFFGNEKCAVIDYRTLDNILQRCDGDIAYVQWAIQNLNQLIDQSLKIVQVECQVGSTTVIYEGVTLGQVLDFGQNKYKSDGIDIQFAQDFIKSGGHPFDFFPKSPSSDEIDS